MTNDKVNHAKPIAERVLLIIEVFAIILLVWFVHILFHNLDYGMTNDDWSWLFTFDSYSGNLLDKFLTIKKNTGNSHDLQQSYYIGLLKTFFGLNQFAFRLTTMFFKSLAALSLGFLILKLTKDKLFAFLTVFFFIVFPSTAGLFVYYVTGINYLIIVFMCFSIIFYIQSVKNPKAILLASLFFLLALSAGPARAYLLIPIPLIIELIRFKKEFKPLTFLTRLLFFYSLPLIFLRETNGHFQPLSEFYLHLRQIVSGNLYTLTLPLQMVSTLFVDQQILLKISENSLLRGFLIMNAILFVCSILLGLVIVGKRRLKPFLFSVILGTLSLEIVVYLFGVLSMQNGVISFIDQFYTSYWLAPLNPTVLQASLGGYFLILGLILIKEWRNNQRHNYILKITILAWAWSILSEEILLLTNNTHHLQMIWESNDRYVIVCSLGAVVFTAGIICLSFRSLGKISNRVVRLLLISLLGVFILLFSWENHKVLNKTYYTFRVRQGGGSSDLQETLYKKFLDKFGKNKLQEPIFLYIDDGRWYLNDAFNTQLRYRIYYNENGGLIRNICKATIFNFDYLKKAYIVSNEEKGFKCGGLNRYECNSVCIGETGHIPDQTIYYPLSHFYAYRIENNDFVDIKEEILDKLNQIH